MLAARLAPDGLEITQVDEAIAGPGELRLRVDLAGVCGTDLHALAAGIPNGTILGHEFTGTVIEVGDGINDRIRVGQRVVSLPVRACGHCVACLDGDLMHCPQARLVGNQGDTPGAFAEQVVVGVDSVVAVPDSVSDRSAALAEPLAVALHIVRRAGLTASDTVLVVGAGPIGLAVTLWARHLGARRIVVSDPVAPRRRMARSCGATDILDPGSESVGRGWRALGLSARPDLVIECTGRPAVLQQCLDILPRGGRLMVGGLHNDAVPLALRGAFFKELTVIFASWYEKQDFEYTVDMLGSGRLDPSGLQTDIVGLGQLPAAFEALKSPSNLGKLLVNPRG